MPAQLRSFIAHLRAHAAAYLVLAVGLAATSAVALYVQGALRTQERARFDELAGDVVAAVRERMEAYAATLRATRGLFQGGREPSRDELREFVKALELESFYPGIQGIGYAREVAPADLARHEAGVREEGFLGYRVWPAGARGAYAPIVALEPLDWRNRRALGFDMWSEPVRREAMARARDGGQAACTARVELVQEVGEDRQPGFLIYLPVYTGRADTVAERRARMQGFVYAPFRAGDLLRATLASAPLTALGVEVYDGEVPAPRQLLFRSRAPGAPEAAGGPVQVFRVDVAGRPWTLRLAATPGFAAGWGWWLPRWVGLAGALISLLLFHVTRREMRAAADARRAGRRSAFLADAGQALSSSLDYRATLAEVARRAARDQADWCAVLLLEPEGPIRLVGHRDEARARQAEVALGGLPLDPPAGAAAGSGRAEPWLAQEVDEAALRRLARSPAQLEGLRAARLASLLWVPLRARGEPLGAIALASCDPARRFDAADLALAQDLARLAVSAIDTARLYRRAQEAVRLRDEFLSIASHELKTPLTSLALQSDSLRGSAGRPGVPEKVAQKAEAIRRNVDRLARLVASLLDISRIGAGRLELDLEAVDLAEVVREVTGRFEDELARAGCALRLEVEGPVVGRWDRLRLDQVLTNLVGNAVKYGPGRPITVGLRTRGERVVLTVRDEGIGIPPEAQERIFRRFERAVSDRHYGGFGLGLWIVRRIVEALGGEIQVESAPGRGATFTVELSREASAGARPHREEEQRAGL